MQNSDHVSLREFLEEKLQHLSTRLDSIDSKYEAALLALEKSIAAAFASSEKAILKAEEAQRAYNAAHNDLLRKQEAMMPRPEFSLKMEGVDKDIAETRRELNFTREVVPKEIAELRTSLMAEISSLRESRSESGGKSVGMHASWGIMLGAAGLISTILSIAAVLISLFR